ncbi:MAG: bifunctional adenosylcobinamide kinase/adenosylcobinamide-phosphate guanylyltransferase [Nitrospirae bacterium]|nr:MAG: bifunctional adenosylcobinamide kinase/adenosylcobinamide-phosphate guanylyltransferase [Nitrospirota bacterium]
MKYVRHKGLGVRSQGKSLRPSHLTPHALRLTSSRRSQLILVIGGASSGKSAAALDLAGKSAKRAFVATGEPLDEEMAEKILRHRASRGGSWQTHEVPSDLVEWMKKHGQGYQSIVIDCLTLWLSNLLGRGLVGSRMYELVSDLLQAIRATTALVVVVTNELGLGLVPMDASGRRFRDLVGQVNQQVAAEADAVYFVLSGLPTRMK